MMLIVVPPHRQTSRRMSWTGTKGSDSALATTRSELDRAAVAACGPGGGRKEGAPVCAGRAEMLTEDAEGPRRVAEAASELVGGQSRVLVGAEGPFVLCR